MRKMNNIKRGNLVRLVEDTMFYKKGDLAKVINASSNGNNKKIEIRYLKEDYIGGDVDVIPKYMIEVVE